MRELPATSVILGMCAGRWGRNGSSQRRIISPKVAKSRCRRDRSLTIAMVPAGTPKYWFLDRRIWAKKKPIPRPTDCYLDCERRRYFEKIANTLTFWRQKRQKPMNSYGFSYILRPELGFVRGSAPGEGPGQLPEPPPDLLIRNEWGGWDPSWK